MDVNWVIAQNLKRLRAGRNLSLGQLAELAGLSKVMLSQIERGASNPTINTIWKIAAGLQVPYTALLDRPAEDAQIVQKDTLTAQQDEAGHYRIYCYYPSMAERNFEWFLLELDAGSDYVSVGHLERAQEYIMVFEGTLLLEQGGQTYRLGPEDSLHFAASAQHTYRNEGVVMAKALILNYYPL